MSKAKKQRFVPLWLKYSTASLAVFSLVFIITISISTIWRIHSQIEELVETWFFLSSTVSTDIEEEVKETEKILSFLAEPELLTDVFEHQDYKILTDYRSEMIGKCDAFYVFDFEQYRLLSIDQSINQYHGESAVSAAISDEYLHTAVEKAGSGRSYISKSYFDPITMDPVFLISYPIVDGDTVLGTLVMRYNMVHLWGKVDSLEIADGVEAYLVNEDRRIVAHTDHNLVGQTRSFSMIDQAFEGFRGVDEILIDGNLYVGAFAPISFRSSHSLIVLHEHDSAVAQIYQTLLYSSLLGVGSVLVIVILAVFLGRILSKPVEPIVKGIQDLAKSVNLEPINVKSRDEFGLIARNFNQMVLELQEKENIKRAFGQYISSDIRDEILKGDFAMEGEEKDCSILFSDIRGFTRLSEKFPAKTILEILNRYFAEMIKVIDKNHGIVNKFIGDALMVLYGVPLQRGNHSEQAVRSALEMIKALEDLNDDFEKEYGIRLQIGIGIATGKVIAGNIGVIQRKEYSVIGDIVNVASRLEKATKKVNKPLIFTDETAKHLPSDFPTKVLGRYTIRGKDQPLILHTVQQDVFRRFGIRWSVPVEIGS